LVRLCNFAGKILLDVFSARQAFGHRRQLLAARNHAFLQFLEIAPEVHEFFRGLGGFGFGSGSYPNRFGEFRSRLLGARAGSFGFAAETGDFLALAVELEIHAEEFSAGFVALVSGGDEGFLRFHLLRSGGGQLPFALSGFLFQASLM
jgi:hypothetical protein